MVLAGCLIVQIKIMRKLHYEIEINASPELVWNAMWEESNYLKWTQVFSPGSYAVSDWQEGSSVHFLNGEGKGMYSKISKLIPNQSMHFHHIGEIDNFKEIPNDGSSPWAGANETYDLLSKEGKTYVICTVDMVEEYVDFFNGVFPKGLEIIKEISEK